MNIFYQILGGNMILYFSTYVIGNLGIEDKRTTIMINIFLLLWKAGCSVGGIFLLDKIGARKPLSKCSGGDHCSHVVGLTRFLPSRRDIRHYIPPRPSCWSLAAFRCPPREQRVRHRSYPRRRPVSSRGFDQLVSVHALSI